MGPVTQFTLDTPLYLCGLNDQLKEKFVQMESDQLLLRETITAWVNSLVIVEKKDQGCALREITRSPKFPNYEIQGAQHKDNMKEIIIIIIWSPKGKS